MISPCYNLNSNFPSPSASRPLCVRTIVAGRAGGLTQTAAMIKSFKDVTPVKDGEKRHALFKDISGVRFGRLVAEKPVAQKRYQYIWLCKCDCGKIVEVLGGRLNCGKTTSCGCLKMELDRTRTVTHGKSKSRTYHIWNGIKNRCYNPSVKAYPDYGGRGITMCDRWKDSFQNFLDDMGESPEGLSIDRINNDGCYEPSNCRWTTMLVQVRNSRKAHKVTAFGKTLCLSEWEEQTGVDQGLISRRIKKGWTPENAISIPMEKPRTISFEGLELTVSEWSSRTGISCNAINKRLKTGWSIKDALNLPPGPMQAREQSRFVKEAGL